MEGYQYHDPAPRARAAIIGLAIWMAALLLMTALSFHTVATIDAYQAGVGSYESLTQLDQMNAAGAIFLVLAYLTCVVLVGMWIYRTNKNAHVMSGYQMSISPGWAVGWFFIPIANLWKPFEAMRETWRASFEPGAPEAASISPLLGFWWAAWVIGSILDNITLRMSLGSQTLEEIQRVTWLEIYATPVHVFSGVALIWIVWRLSAAQRNPGGVGEVFA